jgi:REP element-mobilizing transposase RayT
METFFKQTTVVCTKPPVAFSMKFNSFETMFNLHYQIILRVAGESGQIEEKWRLPIYKYLASYVRICGGSVESIGGAPDRVHLLVALPSSKVLAEFLRELKLLSQTWARRKMQIPQFAWQDGVEAFTVSPMQRERVKASIHRQAKYYRKQGGQEEYAESWRRNSLPTKSLVSTR